MNHTHLGTLYTGTADHASGPSPAPGLPRPRRIVLDPREEIEPATVGRMAQTLRQGQDVRGCCAASCPCRGKHPCVCPTVAALVQRHLDRARFPSTRAEHPVRARRRDTRWEGI